MKRLSFDIYVYNRCMPSSFRGVYPAVEPVPECKVTFTIPGTNRTVERVTTNKYGHAKVALKPGGYNLKVEPKATIRQRSQRTPPRDWPSFPAKPWSPETQPNRIWLTLQQSPTFMVTVWINPRGDLRLSAGGAIAPHQVTARMAVVKRSDGTVVKRQQLRIGLQPLWMQPPSWKRFRRVKSPSLIVIHCTGGSTTAPALAKFATLPGDRSKSHASIHYVIERSGRIIKVMHESMWVAHVAHGYWKRKPWINKFSVGIELIRRANHPYKPDQNYTKEQYESLIRLLKQILKQYPTIPPDGIVGHSDVDTNDKFSSLSGGRDNDPGQLFDWPKLEKNGLGILGPPPHFRPRAEHFPGMYGGFFKNPAGSFESSYRRKRTEELQEDLSKIGFLCPKHGRYSSSTREAVKMFQYHFFGGPRKAWKPPKFTLGKVDATTAAMIKYVALPHLLKVYLSSKSASDIGKVLNYVLRTRPIVLQYFETKERAEKQGWWIDRAILRHPSGHKETAQGVVDGGLSAEAPAPAAPSATQPVHVHHCSQRSRGFYKYGGGRLDKKLRDMRRGKITISDRDIATLQRIANVEIGGRVRGVWNCDNQILSFGFMQWTVTWGLLQQVIARAPAAFKRYGIELDPGRTYRFKGGRVPAIKGVTDPEKQLRQRDWVARFYRAGLDEDVIAAEVAQAKAKLKTVDAKIKRVLGPQIWKDYFSGDRRDAIIARATLVELYNHRPKYLDPVLHTVRARLDAVARRGALLDDAGFKAILDKAMVERYPPAKKPQAREIIRKISEN